MFTVKVNNEVLEFTEKTSLLSISNSLEIKSYVAKVNNRLRELRYEVDYDCEVEFLDLDEYEAAQVYETSLRYLIVMALERLYPHIEVKFHQADSRAISCHVEGIKDKVDVDFIRCLEEKMRELIDLDLPIHRRTMGKDQAIEMYRQKGYLDKTEVLKYRIESYVNTYECDGYRNYMFGYMVPSTGFINDFNLIVYYPDFIVQYPRPEEGGKIPIFEDSPRFGKMLTEARFWSQICGAETIAKLNHHSENKTVVDFVNMCEAKHNGLLSQLGSMIKKDIDLIRLIAIAGPSSSGKTTFSKRLRVELMINGITPVKISMDDYYLDREQAPLDENGEFDLEHIRALDVELFNKHILALVQGETVELPKFDFKLGRRVRGKKLCIDKNQPIIIEGIHALNEILTASIPKHQKFKIYISPLTQINIDNHSPINATEIRMLRRIVRDAKYRKTTPEDTLAMWASVRRGEFRWIYPFQEQADFVFNTELSYELGVMKKYALPVLEAIDRESEHFIAANRLVKFLKYINDIDDRLVPCNSLLREFIGESCFYEYS